MDLRCRRVVVMGLGRFGGGVGVTRFLVGRGARVLVTDLEPAERLRESLAQLDGLAVDYCLGGHRVDDFQTADLIVVNPAVDARDSAGNRYLDAACSAGVCLTSEIRLLVQRLPNRERVIGITGTAGKSTVAAMIGHILSKALGPSRVHVGGNLGGSLLSRLDAIEPSHWVVLELSSFMLEGLAEDAWSPPLAVVTNIAPNHLDRHATMAGYAAAKQAILKHQRSGDKAILGRSVAQWPTAPGVHRTVLDSDDYDIDLAVPGRHNRVNAMCAITAAELIANGGANLANSLADYSGLPHRLQLIGGGDGVRCFNDSKSTTPEAALLAMHCFDAGTVHLIVGGYDKGADLGPLARAAATHCRAIYTIGATGEAIAVAAAGTAEVVRCGVLWRAVAEISDRVHAGEVVLLSPGCASWDQFENYEQRGTAFEATVHPMTRTK